MSINPRLTKKQIKEGYSIIAYCGYCDLYYTLLQAKKVGHTERAEGWGANIYEITPSICIVTGYAPFGNLRLNYEFTHSYEEVARKFYNNTATAPIDKLYKLWEKLIHDIIALKREQ